MAVDQTRYRQLDFLGARILQARELNWLQEMDQGMSVTDNETSVSGQLQSIYRQGALFNTTVAISGLTVTLSAKDGVNPMLVFVRDRWEIFPGNNDDTTDSSGTYAGNHTITLTNVETTIYLNWELKIRTGGLTGDDPTLTDVLTNEAVASGGELILHLSHVDGSGISLGVGQLAKNLAPVTVARFSNSGSLLTNTNLDNVQTHAKGSIITSGLVATTTNTPVVVSTDDSRMTDGRPAVDASVHDTTVRTPVAAGGTNSDGTPIYNLTGDIGGINAAKMIYVAGTQRVSDFISWIKTQFNNLLTRYNAHETAALGLSNTHPIPTAAQVGAAPLSHVGLPLGLSTSHPPVVNMNSGGFQVNRSGVPHVHDPAYGVFYNGSSIATLSHDGDVYADVANRYGVSGVLPPATTTGTLGWMSVIAQVLSQHVNQVSHNNPHGLTAIDIGAATTTYVNSLFSTGFAISKTTNGYIQLPTVLGSLVVQWGLTAYFPGGVYWASVSGTFPIAFPTTAFVMVASPNNFSGNPSPVETRWPMTAVVNSLSRTGYTVTANSTNSGLLINSNTLKAYWIAVGY